MTGRAETFIAALRQLEDSGDAGPIAALFTADADISNPLVEREGQGQTGAHAFWTSYRSAFGRIHSEFRHVVDHGDMSLLEWVSEGDAGGEPVRYGGVSVLEHGDGGITAFRTYFDPTQVRRHVQG
jgi:ketosteroid isomerase-like protein